MRCIACARCGYARAAAYGKVCHMFFGLSQRSVQCMSLTSKYLPCINVVGVREAKKNTRSRVLLLSLARLCVSRHISLPCDAVCVCVCAVCESVHEHVCVRAGRSVI